MPTYYSPLFENNFPLRTTKFAGDRQLANMFRGAGKRAAVMKALNGAVAGGTATDTRKRVQHSQNELGGIRPIETFTLISRATTATDETIGDTILTPTSRIATPANKAGNFPA